uniref:PDZ domain-containing protein n=1 Tax=Parastrongyloides trichosuri TaxID=131310 RepID=A0A0N4ZMG1_PARTI
MTEVGEEYHHMDKLEVIPKTINKVISSSNNKTQCYGTVSHKYPSPKISWLDSIERDFDNAFRSIDLLMEDFDVEQSDIIYDARQKLGVLSGCFAELVKRHQHIVGMYRLLEGELYSTKEELCEAKGMNETLDKESQRLITNIHIMQCQVQSKTDPHGSDMIKKKLDEEVLKFRQDNLEHTKVKAAVEVLKKDNSRCREIISSMQAELYAARLAAKYLDKELAGRIQQIQLLGRDMRGSEHDRLWNVLESEINLHRHKTVIRACRGRKQGKILPSSVDKIEDEKIAKNGVGKVRIATIRKATTADGLGMSITGGKEHGVPIIVSEIHPGQPAEKCGEIFVGDALLSCNGHNLRGAMHNDAVKILMKEMMEQTELKFEVLYVQPDHDSDDDGEVCLETNSGINFKLYEPFEDDLEKETCASSNSNVSEAHISECSTTSSKNSECDNSEIHSICETASQIPESQFNLTSDRKYEEVIYRRCVRGSIYDI